MVQATGDVYIVKNSGPAQPDRCILVAFNGPPQRGLCIKQWTDLVQRDTARLCLLHSAVVHLLSPGFTISVNLYRASSQKNNASNALLSRCNQCLLSQCCATEKL